MTTEEEARIRADERERCAAEIEDMDHGGEGWAAHAEIEFRRGLSSALRSGTDTDYVCVRREELERFATSAALLLANAEGCAVNHYGEDYALHGTPGWLSDCAADVARLRSLLKEKGGENG
jgi:hypothetical protein